MTIQIFTTVVNRPDFVEIQQKLFKKFLKDEYQFHVVDDSIDEDISKEFKRVCDSNFVTYYRKPQSEEKKFDNPLAGARHATETIQWTYDTIIKQNYSEDLILFCDSDMFLLDDFSLEEYMEGETIAGHLQVRGHVRYIWNGIMFFDMKKISEIDPNLNFSDGVVEGQQTDIGGHLHPYFKKYNIQFKRINDSGTDGGDYPEYPTEYNGVQIPVLLTSDMWCKPEDGYNFELHLDGKFLHYRAGTNWHTQSSWKSKEDPLRVKAEIFNQIIKDFID
jgi:hypothetical protein